LRLSWLNKKQLKKKQIYNHKYNARRVLFNSLLTEEDYKLKMQHEKLKITKQSRDLELKHKLEQLD